MLCAQSCPTLCDPVDCSPPGFSVQGFPRQEYWSGLPFPPRGDLPDPKIQPTSPEPPAGSDSFFKTEPPREQISQLIMLNKLIDYFFCQ